MCKFEKKFFEKEDLGPPEIILCADINVFIYSQSYLVEALKMFNNDYSQNG